MNAYKLLEQHGLEITYQRVGKIKEWYSRNQGKSAVLVIVPCNRRIHPDYMLIGRLSKPLRDVWITTYDENDERARRLLTQEGLRHTQHRIKSIAEWFRQHPGTTPVLVLVDRRNDHDGRPDIIGAISKLHKDILIRPTEQTNVTV